MLYLKATNFFDQEKMPNVILNPSAEFDASYKEEWLDSNWGRQLITDIQYVDVMDTSMSVQFWLAFKYHQPVEDLANGIKNLFLMKYLDDGRYYRMGMMGKNCYPRVCEISKEKDLHGVCVNFLAFQKELFEQGFQVCFEDYNNRCVRTYYDYMSAMAKVSADGLFTEPEEYRIYWED